MRFELLARSDCVISTIMKYGQTRLHSKISNATLVALNQPFTWVAADFLVFVSTVNLVYSVRLDFSPAKLDLPIVAVGLVVLLTSYLFDTFSLRSTRSVPNLVLRSFGSVLCAGIVVAAFVYLFPPPIRFAVFWRGNLPISLLIFSGYAALSRFLLGNLTGLVAQSNSWLFFGQELRYQELLKDVAIGGMPCVIARLTDKTIEEIPHEDGEVGDLEEFYPACLPLLQDSKGPPRIIFDDKALSPERLTKVVVEFRALGIAAISREKFYESQLGRLISETLDEQAIYRLSPASSQVGYVSGNLKRLTDIVLALVGLVLSFPIVLVAYLMVRMTSKGPGFFRQTRVGLSNRAFMLVKLRSMQVNADKAGEYWTKKDDPRVTNVGRVLRKLHIDELPQFWNVLIGDMSLVGPRPEIPEIVSEMRGLIPLIDLRHLVRPGITGWAQVSSGYAASVAGTRLKVQQDLFYIKNCSVTLDLQILLKTTRSVFWQKGQ